MQIACSSSFSVSSAKEDLVIRKRRVLGISLQEVLFGALLQSKTLSEKHIATRSDTISRDYGVGFNSSESGARMPSSGFTELLQPLP